jgi:hypothetical protein
MQDFNIELQFEARVVALGQYWLAICLLICQRLGGRLGLAADWAGCRADRRPECDESRASCMDHSHRTYHLPPAHGAAELLLRRRHPCHTPWSILG